MKLEEIKRLSKKEFAERYPYVHIRERDRKTKETKKAYDEKNDPVLEFYLDDFCGWTDLLLCWAEKVKPFYDQLPEDLKNEWRVTECKEKYGSLRIYTYPSLDDSKISDYTRMAEHLSFYTCLDCGKLTKSSNGKKIMAWRSTGGWISYRCKKCARKRTLFDIKEYELEKNKPLKFFFEKDWKKETSDFYSVCIFYKNDEKQISKIDCRELLKDM